MGWKVISITAGRGVRAMSFNGKKTDVLQLPKQLRTDPELGAYVRLIASANRRNIQGQILHWIIEGVEKDKVRFCQPVSVGVRSEEERKRA